MAQHHKRKRVARSSPIVSSPSLAAAIIAVALLADGSLDLASARRDGSSAQEPIPPHGGLRRARAEGSVRGSSPRGNRKGKVNLLVKYKDGPARARSLGNYEGNSSAMDTWQSHTTCISTISEDSHIATVELDVKEIGFVMDEMKADDDVELVEEDFPMYKYPYDSIQQFDSPDLHLRRKQRHLTQQHNRTLMESQQYGIAQTQASAVWALTKSKPNKYPNTPVKVCIIDTGYDGSHEDLPKVGVTSTDSGYGDSLDDGDGHGTHCAGVIGAVGNNGRGIVGVNPDPTKFSFHISKALNDDGLGTASSVLTGIKGCISSGSKVISMSLGGGPESKIFNEMYKEAYDNDVLVFAAAGNVGMMTDDYPASYPLVVSVGAVDRNGNRADFSNWNNQLELMGPGENIMSTFPGNGYGMLSGTSMATPYVAGVAALVWGYFPQCSNQQIRNVLARSAMSVAPNGAGCDPKTGFGLVQAKSAFDLLDTYGCAAGGENYSPPSAGGVGGCDQPLADLSELMPMNDISTASFTTGISSSKRCKRLLLDMLTDDYGYETSWELKRVEDGKVLKFGPDGSGSYADRKKYSPASDCLADGAYQFSIMDTFGDGLNPPAFYTISLDGETLAQNSDFGHEETTSFTVNNSPSAEEQQPNWTSLLYEDFHDGFGKFSDGGMDAMHVDSKFGRSGLAMIKKGSADFDQASVYSQSIPLDDRGFKNFKVKFSFYANNKMMANARFCLDYSTNGASAWRRAKCWKNKRDFASGEWNDDEVWEFQPSENFVASSIRIRFRGFSSEIFNRIFIDKVRLFGSI